MVDIKKIVLPLAVLASVAALSAKKPLDHDAFDLWESVTNHGFSRSGDWAAYSVNPQEGDGVLLFRNVKSGKTIGVDRGYRPAFTADGKWAVAQIKPLFRQTREAKIAKKKNFDLPQDSLAIVDLSTGKVERVADVISFKIGKEGGSWVAYQSCDTSLISPKALADKKAGRPLVVRHLGTDLSRVVNWVKDYSVSDDGLGVAFTMKKMEKDSLATDGVGVIMLPDTAMVILDRDKSFYGAPVFNRDGSRLAFTSSTDTIDSGTKDCMLYVASLDSRCAAERIEMSATRGKNLFINQYSTPEFSYDGKRLIVGVAPAIAPDDTTLVDFEKGDLDIWRWDAPYTPPQELANLKSLRERTMPVVTDLVTRTQVLVTDRTLADVESPSRRWTSDWALVADPTEYIVEQQWNYIAPTDLSLVNLCTGEKRDIVTSKLENYAVSPEGRFLVWYDRRQFHAYDVAAGKTVCISSGIPYPIWDEDDDHPMEQPPYGIAAWTAGDGRMLIYDRYDIWSLDPKGESDPVCLTAGEGRRAGTRFRYIKTDPDAIAVADGEEMLLSVFDFDTKQNGLATLKYTGKKSVPIVRENGTFSFSQIRKASKGNGYSWLRGNFNIMPDLYISDGLQFSKADKATSINPQMAEYSWGDARLVRWYAYNGDLSEGVLYTPENFDPDKEYPLMTVFYETNSENLYRHYTMEPSWSWVNYPFYVSRGYVVFVPDIHYTPGVPGENAYNYVCSGVEEVCRQLPNIDRNRIGIDGQSWGGYQTAFLVTRTDMFACAGSGAPVANMTSAFGGIRWGTGDSRQGQYEQGQSRIGRNLWDAPELYIYNSPVFHADRVNTPLLIMHNDNDGAVPWYQGIEMFMALRRLRKPVWMLQYNGEAHNIKERRNRKDITKRLQQFFDHYLLGSPMPEWMKNGIPTVRKGQDYGFGLTE